MATRNSVIDFDQCENRSVLNRATMLVARIAVSGRRILDACLAYSERAQKVDTRSFNGIL